MYVVYWVGVGVTLTILNNNFFKLKQTSKHKTLYRNNLFSAVVNLTPTPTPNTRIRFYFDFN